MLIKQSALYLYNMQQFKYLLKFSYNIIKIRLLFLLLKKQGNRELIRRLRLKDSSLFNNNNNNHLLNK